MKRRDFIAISGAAVALPSSVWAAEGFVEYKPGVIEAALANGETVLVDYAASWCSTCKAQERVIKKLRAEYPGYNEAITFVRVDWDNFGGHEVTKSRKVPRRSTLLVLKGNDELGRIVAGTSEADIKSLLDIALNASV